VRVSLISSGFKKETRLIVRDIAVAVGISVPLIILGVGFGIGGVAAGAYIDTVIERLGVLRS
jgi:hypothetical protein